MVSEIEPGQLKPIRSGSGGVSRVLQPQTWCDLWRCRERITKLHSEGGAEGHPVADPQHGHQPKNWPPLDGMSMPSDKTSLTSLWNRHTRTEKGEMEVEFRPTCGAAQEKQSAAALPSLTPPALPGFLVWGVSGALATTGAIPRTGF